MSKKIYSSRMTRDIYEDPAYWLGSAFFSGILFSTWSWGILYLILFMLIYEIFYAIYCQYNGSKLDIGMRIGLFCGAFMGFLIGRCITKNDDHEKSINDFCFNAQNYYKKYGYTNKHNKKEEYDKLKEKEKFKK